MIARASTLSRRKALAAAGVAVAFAPFSSPPVDAKVIADDREFWLAKWKRFLDADKAFGDASGRADGAEFDAMQEYPPTKLKLPTIVGVGRKEYPGKIVPAWDDYGLIRNTIELRGMPADKSKSDIAKYFEEWLHESLNDLGIAKYPADFVDEGKRRQQKLFDEVDHWVHACRDIDNRHGLPALSIALDAACDELEMAEQDIIDAPASSFAGIAVKLAIWGYGQVSQGNDYFDKQAVASALETATALAGLPADFWKPPIKYRQIDPAETASPQA